MTVLKRALPSAACILTTANVETSRERATVHHFDVGHLQPLAAALRVRARMLSSKPLPPAEDDVGDAAAAAGGVAASCFHHRSCLSF